ncbi:MAG: hypothetical protein K2N35_11235 [Muribaculaceae bacterium]|nr:hypothetical protein [Muribaculaceae bacterium]
MKRSSLMLFTAFALGFTSCSKDDEPNLPNPDVPTIAEGAFVLNQGNYGKQIEGSLTLIDYSSKSASQNLFQRANGRSLGSTPQGAVAYGGKIYLAIYESNVIEIIDRTTFKSLKQISLSDAEGQSPRSLIAKDGKVYVSMFNGYVSRLDTLSLTIDKSVKVGPNPEIMAIKGDYLYVPNSEGMNYPNYGTTASKINLKSFSVEKTFDVGLNPCQFASNGTDLFLLCTGNYGDTQSKIYRIDNNDNSTEVDVATLMAIKDNKLYYINAPYFGVTDITYTTYDIASGSKTKMIGDNGVDSPAGLGVDPINGNIVVTSYSIDNGVASYATDGYAKVYSSNGSLLNRYDVGVGPCAVFFNYK